MLVRKVDIAEDIVSVFYKTIIIKHRNPEVLITDRDKLFTLKY